MWMTRRRILPGVLVLLGFATGCSSALPPDVLRSYQSRTLYTCCNLHFDGSDFNDANYHVDTLLPLGTMVQLKSVGRHSVTFVADGRAMTLSHEYGREQESFQQFLDKILVTDNPSVRVGSFERPVREAIRQGRVEPGMTKEQVILSLGYPPTHRTASLSSPSWVYWYNRWFTFQVIFDENQMVASIVGLREDMRQMVTGPTRNEPVGEPAR